MRQSSSKYADVSSECIDQLKYLLDLISKPEELKKTLDELKAYLVEYEVKSEELKQKQLALTDLETGLAVKELKTNEALKYAEEAEKVAKQLQEKLMAKERALEDKEKSLLEKVTLFDTKSEEISKQLESKQTLLDIKLKENNELTVQLETLKKEYEEKLSKLKNIIN